MKHNFTSLLCTAVAAGFLLSACNQATGNMPQPAPAADNTKTILFDDFSGPGLDSSRWNVEVTGMHVNDELQAYVDSALTISFDAAAAGAQNGALVLQPRYTPGFVTRDGQKFDFISGRINTRNKFEFAYGTAAARIKLTDGVGLWPAWWMLGNGAWPETGEIDIMEYVGEKDWISAAIHGKGYSGDAGLVDRYYFPDSNNVTGWHIYAVDWTPESLVFKYDNMTMFRITKSMTNFFGPWAFDNPKYLLLNFAVGGIYPFKINGIKQPYYGLPAATLEDIKAGKSKMLVDWVKVTKN
ncbi:MAG: glycoside hydrolase family 16 protein [Ferruginibacter sp.]